VRSADIGRRLSRLEAAGRPDPEDERPREQERERIREAVQQSIEHSLREGNEPVFEITDDGDVFCARDGKPVTEYHQTLAEEWYWDYVAWGNPGGLIHDEQSEGFYMPTNGELAFSRDRCYLPRFFWAIGDPRADPYCISVPERIDISKLRPGRDY
jgi:hypothetical protein